MKFEEFVRKVGAHAGIADRFEAEKTAVVVLQQVCDRLPGKEANDMLSQLPAMFRELVVVSPSPLPISGEMLVDRVADELGVTGDEARRRIRGVFAVLRESLTRGEFEDVFVQLDPEYADFLA